MSGTVIRFPPKGPFAIAVMREGNAWLVVARDHGWLHGDRHTAMREARELADAWRVGIKVLP